LHAPVIFRHVFVQAKQPESPRKASTRPVGKRAAAFPWNGRNTVVAKRRLPAKQDAEIGDQAKETEYAGLKQNVPENQVEP